MRLQYLKDVSKSSVKCLWEPGQNTGKNNSFVGLDITDTMLSSVKTICQVSVLCRDADAHSVFFFGFELTWF